MFEKYVPCLSEDGEESNLVSPMDVAVTAASQFLRTKIKDIAETKGGKRDGVGVVSVLVFYAFCFDSIILCIINKINTFLSFRMSATIRV